MNETREHFIYTSKKILNDGYDLLWDEGDRCVYVYCDCNEGMDSIQSFDASRSVERGRFQIPFEPFESFMKRLRFGKVYYWGNAGMAVYLFNQTRGSKELVFIGGEIAETHYREQYVNRDCFSEPDWSIRTDPLHFQYYVNIPDVVPDWENYKDWPFERFTTPDACEVCLFEIAVAEERWEVIDNWFEKSLDEYRNKMIESIPKWIYSCLVGGPRNSIAEQLCALQPDLSDTSLPGVIDAVADEIPF